MSRSFDTAMILKNTLLLVIFICLFSAGGCGDKKPQANKPQEIEIPESALNLNITRFEKEIFERKKPFDSSDIVALRKEHGKFFDLWCSRLAGIIPPTGGPVSDTYLAYNLNQYVSDKYIRLVYDDCKKQYENIDQLKSELTDIFKRYTVLFPGKHVPDIITYISPFTSNVMAMDSALGLGLHFYLGADYKYYSSLNLPKYMTSKFDKSHIIPDLLKGWLDSEFTNDTIHRSFLNNLIYQGKLMYAIDLLSPEVEDSLKIGYTKEQFDWALKNEQTVWTFFVEQQLLYDTNPKQYMKFINDGNSTSGFPKEAPAQLGIYIGWQIVRSFMKQHPETSLPELFRIQDSQLILSQSGYKPAKIS